MRSFTKFAWMGLPALVVGAVIATSSVAPAAAISDCSIDWSTGQCRLSTGDDTGFVLERPVQSPVDGHRFFARGSDPARFASLGIEGLGVNDRIEVVALGGDTFRATTAHGQSRVVVARDGRVQLAQ